MPNTCHFHLTDQELNELIENGYYKQRYTRHKPDNELVLNLAKDLQLAKLRIVELKAELTIRTSDDGCEGRPGRVSDKSVTAYRNGFSKGWRNREPGNPYIKGNAIIEFDAGYKDGKAQAGKRILEYLQRDHSNRIEASY
jgi:hypothetical protein